MNIIDRLQSPTPPFFQKIRNIGIILAAISGAILAVPQIPAIVVKIATYIGLAGTVATTISQAVTMNESDEEKGSLVD